MKTTRKTSIRIVRLAAGTHGGLVTPKTTDDQLWRWWSTVDPATQAELTVRFSEPAAPGADARTGSAKTTAKPAAKAASNSKQAHPARPKAEPTEADPPVAGGEEPPADPPVADDKETHDAASPES